MSDLVKKENSSVVVNQSSSFDLINNAMQNGISDPQILKEMMDLAERNDAHEAKKAFHSAMSRFSRDMPIVGKTKDGYNFKYAPIEHIRELANPILAKNGLSIRFENKDSDCMKFKTVTCIVSHKDGHSESTSESSEIVTLSGKPADAQRRGATSTYLQRYSMIGALGIVVGGDDDEGLLTKADQIDTITSYQIQEIESLIIRANRDSKTTLNWLSSKFNRDISNIEDMNTKEFNYLSKSLNSAIKKIRG